jgi:hypothetical protein
LNSNESVVVKELHSGHEFLSFNELIQVFHDNVLVGSIDNDTYSFFLGQDCGNAIVNDSTLFVEEQTQVAFVDSVFGFSLITILVTLC